MNKKAARGGWLLFITLKMASLVFGFWMSKFDCAHFLLRKKMVSPVRLELTTPCLKGRCSNQLSYGPNMCSYYMLLYNKNQVFMDHSQ